MDLLSPKHRLFVEAYHGDVVEAMQVAGFVADPAILKKKGEDLLKNPTIQKAIRERSKYLAKTQTTIADREERQAFWTALMRNQDPNRVVEYTEHGVPKKFEPIPLAQRIKASELLGKSEVDFVERIDMSANLTVTDIITQAYSISNDELDAIEAEYNEVYHKDTAPIEPKEEEPAESEEEKKDIDGFI